MMKKDLRKAHWRSSRTCRYGMVWGFALCMVLAGCLPEDIALPFRIKSVSTNDATDITRYSASLSGVVSTTDADTITCGIIYGLSDDLSAGSGTQVATTSKGDYVVAITDLTPQCTYYYRAYAVEVGRYKYGEIHSFVTRDDIVAVTGEATAVTVSTATLGGAVTGTDEPLACGIIYGLSDDLSSASGTKLSTTSKGSYSFSVAGLSENTTYHYRAYVVDGEEYKYGEVRSFTTKKSVSVTTGDVTDITTDGAVMSGTVNNSDQSLTCGIIYGLSDDLSSASGTKLSTTSKGSYSFSVAGLSENTTYHYRAYVVDGEEYKYGEVRSFTTEKILVTVTTGDATDVTLSRATLNGTVNNAAQALPCGIIYGTASDLSSGKMLSTTSDGSYSLTVWGLEANTTYYYKAYVVDGGEYRYGEARSFATYQAVDLGLSVKWGSCNVGASSSEEYGNYYAWGETTTKSDYSSSNSVTNGLSISELESRGIIGADGNLTAAYDAATVNWGGGWRMPTVSEIQELFDKCTWTWTSVNGINGYNVTGPNGNSIFLPAAGCRNNESLYSAGSYGYYWSATPYGGGSYACILYFNSGYYDWGSSYRSYGQAVRPVSE